MPSRNSPAASSEVPDGSPDEWLGDVHGDRTGFHLADDPATPAFRRRRASGGPICRPVHVEINDRRRVQRQELREQQAADDRDAHRPAQFRAGAVFQRQRQRAEQRGHRRHHDRTEPQQAGLVNRFLRRQSLLALRIQREINHHDRVLLHDADQQDDPDQGIIEKSMRQIISASNAPTPAEGRRGENRDRMDVAFVEHAQDDVDDDDGRQDQERLALQRGAEFRGAAGERRRDRFRQADLLSGPAEWRDRLAQRTAGLRLNDNVTAGNWPSWMMASGAVTVRNLANALSGTIWPVVDLT